MKSQKRGPEVDTTGIGESRHLRFGDFALDLDDERLRGAAGPVRLGNKAYRLLVELIEQKGCLLTKTMIFSTIWDGTIVSESALTSAVKELRRALGDETRTPKYIETVYGRGYRFVAAISSAGGGASADEGLRPLSRPAPAAVVAKEGSETRPPVVVVSEFNDAAVRASHPHCGPGLREEVLSGLARFREIQLVADDRSGVQAGGGEAFERGYRLSAALVPEGSGVKIIARASRLSDGLVLWAETLSLADAGMAASVEKIVRRIIGAALPAVDDDLFVGLSHAPGSYYDRYLVTRRRSIAPRDFDEAKVVATELESLVAERPDFGLAYPPLVRLYNTDFGYTGLGSTAAAERHRALALAQASLSADRANVHAYTVLGFCHLYHGDHVVARSYLDRALALNPYNAVRLNEVAAGMIYLGEFERARTLLEMSLQLQAFADDNFQEDMGRLLFLEGDCTSARKTLGTIPRCSIWAELYKALCGIRLGLEDASAELRSWRARVDRDWHSGSQPLAGDILAWVRFHHPFAGEAGAALFMAVEEALELPAPAARAER